MRTLRRITAATALAAASFVVPAAHAAPPVPDIPRPACETLDVEHLGICDLLPAPVDFYYHEATVCTGQLVVPMNNGYDIWAFAGGVGGGEWVASVTTHCYVGNPIYGARSDMAGPVGFMPPSTGVVPVTAGGKVCTEWDVTFVANNPWHYTSVIRFRPPGC
jgi:hypothetical protein